MILNSDGFEHLRITLAMFARMKLAWPGLLNQHPKRLAAPLQTWFSGCDFIHGFRHDEGSYEWTAITSRSSISKRNS